MKVFLRNIGAELLATSWRQCLAVMLVVFATYGMLLFNPVTAYDFSAAKGDFFQVFLTYFFMHRLVQGLVAGAFHDFTPFWTLTVGLCLLAFAGMIILVLFKRLGFCKCYSLIGVALWLSTPFFFNRSIYQHALPSESLAFCCDAVAMLGFLELKRVQFNRCLWMLVVGLCVISASVYQAHVNLLLTGFMGIVALDHKDGVRSIMIEWLQIAWILLAAVIAWFLINHGPILVAKLIGIVIPKSGGAHDTIYWFTGDHTFFVNVKSLLVGFILNWGYNAFFIFGLRCVLLAICFCLAMSLAWCISRKWHHALASIGFALSIFVFPVIQCSFANLRTFYCFIPFLAFSGMLLLQFSSKRLFAVFMTIVALGMAHETSTLYYYNWKVKEHDKLHMSIVAHDLWERYGLKIEKPVAIIGGWKHYPTCWEDLRPFRSLPLINYPFTTYANMTSANVPREFYMVAREKVGLLVSMPDQQTYNSLCSDNALLAAPAYPMSGYIFEHDGVIVVNLGRHNLQWGAFRYGDFASPNEKLLADTLGLSQFGEFMLKSTSFFREMAKKYPWTLVLDPIGSGKR